MTDQRYSQSVRRSPKILSAIRWGLTGITRVSLPSSSFSPLLSSMSAATSDVSFLIVLLFCLCGLIVTFLLLRVLPLDAVSRILTAFE